ncbi:helix-turn-helix domain-containing protein [Chryseolinea sp. T2]|uniref:helix-turn-helix domain-containing protein n=1 Tax=Chryseolinea sp. T2 TaxID=3129255 RepID=UPI0030775708
MKFEKHFPSQQLEPYIRFFVVSENTAAQTYKVFPTSALVMGFQYSGRLSSVNNNGESTLSRSGITGLSSTYKVFRNSPNIGTILVYFTETGFAHFGSHPAHELFNLSVSLDYIFDRSRVMEVEEKLAISTTDKQRIRIVEHFLISQLTEIQHDKLVVEAVRLIYESKGGIRIKELNERLSISQSPLEKRFRKVVGTTPKKFASIVRLNHVITSLNKTKSLTEICYDNNFFDQAHFNRDFKQFTGETPENFKRLL